jgi:membrane protein DedA with SNARE-associated domain
MNVVEIISSLEALYISYGYSIVFLSSLIEITPMGWTIPGGVLLAAGGFFAYSGRLSLLGVLIFSWLGAWATFILAYLLGNKIGYRVVKRLKQEKNAEKAKALLLSHGGVILTTSMMANLTRFWVAFVAGAEDYNPFKFLFYSAAASLTWSSLMVVVGYLAGSERVQLESALTKLGIVAWVLFLGVAVFIFLKARKEFKHLKGEVK